MFGNYSKKLTTINLFSVNRARWAGQSRLGGQRLLDRLLGYMDSPVVEKTVIINNPQGLHARPAELFARLALRFDSKIEVIREDLRVDAKSILHVLTLGASQGTELTLQAHGTDAQQALEAIARLVESDFATDETLSQESSS